MARASFHLDRGHLAEAVKELEHIQGYPKVLVNDWNNLACSRLIADQAVATLRSSAVLRHAAFAKL